AALIDRLLVEVVSELRNRPAWLIVPLAALVETLGPDDERASAGDAGAAGAEAGDAGAGDMGAGGADTGDAEAGDTSADDPGPGAADSHAAESQTADGPPEVAPADD